MMALLHTGLYFALAVGCVLAKGHNADIHVHENTVDDKIVEELLHKDVKNVKTFATDYLAKQKSQLSFDEAMGIISKVQDMNQIAMSELGAILDAAGSFKSQLTGCATTKGKTVDSFLEEGLAKEVKKTLAKINDSFQCPEKKLVPTSSSGFDWQFVEDLKQKLKSDPMSALQNFVAYLLGKGYITPETMPMFTLIGGEMVKNQDVIDYILSFFDTVDYYFKSESGKRLLDVVPKLMEANGSSAMEILAKEADYNQEVFFNLLQNNDMASYLLKSIAKFILSAFQWGKVALDDNLKMAVVNGMLISNNFPSINKKKLLKSTTAIAEKLLELLTSVRLDVDLYHEVRVVADEFEKLYFRFDDFQRLTEPELVNVLSQFLKDNALEPFKDAWVANRHVTMVNASCGEIVICLFNQNYRDTNEILRTVAKGLSMAMAYSWTGMFDEPDYDHVNKAIWVGLGKEKCQEIYESAPKSCDVFAQRRQQIGMNLNYEHNEL